MADAWFDVLTSPGGWDLVEAVAMSVLAELPLAALCFWLAFHSQEVTERRLLLLAGRRRSPGPAGAGSAEADPQRNPSEPTRILFGGGFA